MSIKDFFSEHKKTIIALVAITFLVAISASSFIGGCNYGEKRILQKIGGKK